MAGPLVGTNGMTRGGELWTCPAYANTDRTPGKYVRRADCNASVPPAE